MQEQLLRTLDEMIERDRRAADTRMTDLVTNVAPRPTIPAIDLQHYVPQFDMPPRITTVESPNINLVRQEITYDFRKQVATLPDLSAFLATTVDSSNPNLILESPQKIAPRK